LPLLDADGPARSRTFSDADAPADNTARGPALGRLVVRVVMPEGGITTGATTADRTACCATAATGAGTTTSSTTGGGATTAAGGGPVNSGMGTGAGADLPSTSAVAPATTRTTHDATANASRDGICIILTAFPALTRPWGIIDAHSPRRQPAARVTGQ
jgi:hypothetical protein